MMSQRTVLPSERQLAGIQRHVQWLQANLPQHSITVRTLHELAQLQAALDGRVGDTVEP